MKGKKQIAEPPAVCAVTNKLSTHFFSSNMTHSEGDTMTYVFPVCRFRLGNVLSEDLLKTKQNKKDTSNKNNACHFHVRKNTTMFSSASPDIIHKVGFGQVVVFWGDPLVEHNISQQFLVAQNLEDTNVGV